MPPRNERPGVTPDVVDGLLNRFQEEQFFGHHRELNSRELLNRYHGECWIGPDVHIQQDVTLFPFKPQWVPMIITPDNLPDLTGCSPTAVFDSFRYSVRSRYAQLGIHIDDIYTDYDYLESLWPSFLKKEDSFTLYAHIGTLALRPVAIPANTGVFRFFTAERLLKPLRGNDLIRAFKNKEIQIGDEQIPKLVYQEGKPHTNRYAAGVVMTLSNWRKYIKRDKAPINMPTTGGDYRKIIESLISDIKRDVGIKLWLGQTPKVVLNNRIAGVLSPYPNEDLIASGQKETMTEDVYNQWLPLRSSGAEDYLTLQQQIMSNLIDPGTKWPVVVEILGYTWPPKSIDRVTMGFVRTVNTA